MAIGKQPRKRQSSLRGAAAGRLRRLRPLVSISAVLISVGFRWIRYKWSTCVACWLYPAAPWFHRRNTIRSQPRNEVKGMI